VSEHQTVFSVRGCLEEILRGGLTAGVETRLTAVAIRDTDRAEAEGVPTALVGLALDAI
jgi:hypothetical protein